MVILQLFYKEELSLVPHLFFFHLFIYITVDSWVLMYSIGVNLILSLFILLFKLSSFGHVKSFRLVLVLF